MKKVKDFTIGEFIKIADENYDNSCSKCRFFDTDIPCYLYCDLDDHLKKEFKKNLNKKVLI